MFSFLSGVYVYIVAWALLGQGSGDSLGPTHLSDFAVSKIMGRESQTKVKRTHQDYINELIIGILNLIVVSRMQ